ncbi:MAG: T9SS type A sorting domain-containing protein, partial [Pedobacter sp.]
FGPNPTIHQLHVHSSLAEARFRIVDAGGRTVMDIHLKEGSQTLLLPGLKPGIYFVSVFDNKKGQVIQSSSLIIR